METVLETFDRFMKWIGWYNVEEDNTTGQARTKADSRKRRVFGVFLKDDQPPDTDFFLFHVDSEKRTCRYIALHPKRLSIPLIWAKQLGVKARFRLMVKVVVC